MNPTAQKVILAVIVLAIVGLVTRVLVVKNRNRQLRNRPVIEQNVNQAVNQVVPPATNAPGTSTNTSVQRARTSFGVISGGDSARQEVVDILNDLGVEVIRVNQNLGEPARDYPIFLKNGIDIVLNISNTNPSNIDTTYGTQQEWPNSGFPFKDKAVYQKDVQNILRPALPYLRQGRTVYVQCENEVGDASLNPKARYWRGTTDQYITQIQAFHEAVKQLDERFIVVLSSFASETLDNALDPSDAERHRYATSRVTAMLQKGVYEVIDPHFYGCPTDIKRKVDWLRGQLAPGKIWISTEIGGPDPRCSSTPGAYEQDPGDYERRQAEEVRTRLSACAENGGKACLWFSLFDLKREVYPFSHMGLLDPAESPLRKKPAYSAFQSFVAENE